MWFKFLVVIATIKFRRTTFTCVVTIQDVVWCNLGLISVFFLCIGALLLIYGIFVFSHVNMRLLLIIYLGESTSVIWYVFSFILFAEYTKVWSRPDVGFLSTFSQLAWFFGAYKVFFVGPLILVVIWLFCFERNMGYSNFYNNHKDYFYWSGNCIRSWSTFLCLFAACLIDCLN